MGQDLLQEFFQKKKQNAKPLNIDWAARRDAWLKAVDDLYKTITEDYLKASIQGGLAAVALQEKTVNEEAIGEYRINELILRVGDEKVVFSPKGANVVGARGRLDIRGENGDANLMWRDGPSWSLIISRTPKLQTVPLTAESLVEILKVVMRP